MHLKAHDDKESGSRRKAIETQKLLMKKSNKGNLPVGFYLFYALYMVFVRDFAFGFKRDTSFNSKEMVFPDYPKSSLFCGHLDYPVPSSPIAYLADFHWNFFYLSRHYAIINHHFIDAYKPYRSNQKRSGGAT